MLTERQGKKKKKNKNASCRNLCKCHTQMTRIVGSLSSLVIWENEEADNEGNKVTHELCLAFVWLTVNMDNHKKRLPTTTKANRNRKQQQQQSKQQTNQEINKENQKAGKL